MSDNPEIVNMDTEEVEDSEDLSWNLDNLPKELFLHICNYLNTKFIVDVLSRVCTRFKYIIEDDATWKIRLFSRWPSRYPIIRSNNICWKDVCSEREEQHRLWYDNGQNMKFYHLKAAHFAAVDVVQLIEDGKFCVSGSRDHALKIWNIDRLNECSPDNIDLTELNHAQKEAAHQGWIWCMAYKKASQTLFSGSWDSVIKSWDINNFTTETQYFKQSSSVLCLALSGNCIISGGYDRIVSFYDPREGNSLFTWHSHHSRPVLCLVADDKFVISGSEDHKVVVYDRVAGKPVNIIKLNGFAMSLSYRLNHLWVGDNQGFLHVIDPTNQKFELIKTYPSGHKSQVTGVHYSSGSIITSSLDKTVQILEPGDKPKPITTFTFEAGIADISIHEDIVTCANSDDSVSVWLPVTEEL